jgi:hypothetical protein
MDTTPLVDLSPLGLLLLVGAALALPPLAWVWLRHRGADARRAPARADAADAVPHLRPGVVRRLHPPDRLRPGLPGLARLLRQCQPAGCARRDPRRDGRTAWRPGDPWQGLGRDGPPLPGHGVGALILVMAAAAGAAARRGGRPGFALVAHGHAGLGLHAGRVRRAHGHDEALPGHRHAAPAGRARPADAAGGAAGRLFGRARWRCRWACAGQPGCSALAVLQAALGGWVSTNYAVLACRDFPTCQGQWWPEMDFAQGFTLLRELGETAVRRLPALCRADRHPHGPPHRRDGGVAVLGPAGLAVASARSGTPRRGPGAACGWRPGSWPAASATWCSAGPCWRRCSTRRARRCCGAADHPRGARAACATCRRPGNARGRAIAGGLARRPPRIARLCPWQTPLTTPARRPALPRAAVLRADQAAGGAADRLLRGDRHAAGGARPA